MGTDRQMNVKRREFIRHVSAAGTVAMLNPLMGARADEQVAGAADRPRKRIRVGVIGCGSVSRKYFPHLKACPFVELVSTCDIIPERAQRAAARHKVPNHYPHIDKMLAGAPFDLFVDLTDMQEHERLNRQAIEAGKHVWSEKPMANDYAAGRELLDLAKQKGLRFWGAPTVVISPQFAFMAKTLAAGKLGPVAAAHASYGHLGPGWSSFFFDQGGGSMPDLGVYNFSTLTGLLGPARSVVGMTSIVRPTRKIDGKGEIKAEAEDNAMAIMDHGNGILSHVQCGFNYFIPMKHDSTSQDHHTITITGRDGNMNLAGYDWAPHAVDLATWDDREEGLKRPTLKRYAADRKGYVWQNGASVVAECLVTGKEPLITAEHALHVVEIMTAVRESQRTGRRITIESRFNSPVIS